VTDCFYSKETTIFNRAANKAVDETCLQGSKLCSCNNNALILIFFLSCSNVKPKKKTRELYRGFQKNANASLSLYTRFSNLACAPRSLVGDSKFPFFPVLRAESMSGEERRAGYYTKQAALRFSPLFFFH
jgi:hypothetical protein